MTTTSETCSLFSNVLSQLSIPFLLSSSSLRVWFNLLHQPCHFFSHWTKQLFSVSSTFLGKSTNSSWTGESEFRIFLMMTTTCISVENRKLNGKIFPMLHSRRKKIQHFSYFFFRTRKTSSSEWWGSWRWKIWLLATRTRFFHYLNSFSHSMCFCLCEGNFTSWLFEMNFTIRKVTLDVRMFQPSWATPSPHT